MSNRWRQFFWPRLTRAYLLRLGLVAAVTTVLCGLIARPCRLHGRSMEPNYHDGSFALCLRPAYWLRSPRPGEAVMVRFVGERVMLLKRVVAVAGETVEFRGGRLLVNGVVREEPYVKYPCTWELAPRVVKPDCVYVVGDNRNMPVDDHVFGQAPLSRVAGRPLW